MERAQLEQNITSVNLQDMAAILNNTALQVQPFEPNVSRDRGEKNSRWLCCCLFGWRAWHVTYDFEI